MKLINDEQRPKVSQINISEGKSIFVNDTITNQTIYKCCEKYHLQCTVLKNNCYVNLDKRQQENIGSFLVNLEKTFEKSKKIYAFNTDKEYLSIVNLDNLYKKLESKIVKNILFVASAEKFTTKTIMRIVKIIGRLEDLKGIIHWSILPFDSDIDFFDYTLKRIAYSRIFKIKTVSINRISDQVVKVNGEILKDLKLDEIKNLLKNRIDNFSFIGHTRAELAWLDDGIIGGEAGGGDFYSPNIKVIKISEIYAKNIFIFGCFSNKVSELQLEKPQTLPLSAIQGRALSYSGYTSYCYADNILLMYYDSLYCDNFSQQYIIHCISEASKIMGIGDLSEVFLIGDPDNSKLLSCSKKCIGKWTPCIGSSVSFVIEGGEYVYSILVEKDIVSKVQKEQSAIISGYTTTNQVLYGILRKEEQKIYLDLFTDGEFKPGEIFLKWAESDVGTGYKRLNNILEMMSSGIFYSKKIFDKVQILLKEIKNSKIKNKKYISRLSENLNVYKKLQKKIHRISQIEEEYFEELKRAAIHRRINFEEELFEERDFYLDYNRININCPYCNNVLISRKVSDCFSQEIVRKQLFCPQCAIIEDTPPNNLEEMSVLFDISDNLKTGISINGILRIRGPKIFKNSIKYHIYILRGEENNIKINYEQQEIVSGNELNIPFVIDVSDNTYKYLYFLKAIVLIDNQLYIAKRDIIIV